MAHSSLEDEDPSLGEPLRELLDLPVDPSPDFVHRLRGRIERRRLSRDFVSLAWDGHLAVIRELFGGLLDGLMTHKKKDDDGHG